jgi:hypothetical protein
MSNLYLGLDCSTQSFTALLLEQPKAGDPASTRILMERSLNFDQHFPEFGTKNGTLPGEGGVVHSPPQMWVPAPSPPARRRQAAGPRRFLSQS